jgi:LysR family transcriptional regulator, hydrogen peroxide-inducible genes activator
MELQQLRYFARVADLENFTRAAEACHVTQPSLSQQISKLERELGHPLFERLGRGVRLTAAGRKFRDRAIRILNLVDEARGSIADEPDAGRVIVAAIPTIAPYFLPAVLTRFAADCPKARVEVVEETTAQTLRLLHDGAVDVAVMALPLKDESVQTEPLFTEELLAVLPANHRLAGRESICITDLSDEPFVLLHEAHCLTGTSLAFCNQKECTPVVVAETHQLITIQELVRLGHGVSLMPEMAARADGHPDRKYVRLGVHPPTRTVGVAWSRPRHLTKVAWRFVEAVRRFRGDKSPDRLNSL